jgi:hypothetical protein
VFHLARQFLPRTGRPVFLIKLPLFALPVCSHRILGLLSAMHARLARVRLASGISIKFTEGLTTWPFAVLKVCEGVNQAAANTEMMCCMVERRRD